MKITIKSYHTNTKACDTEVIALLVTNLNSLNTIQIGADNPFTMYSTYTEFDRNPKPNANYKTLICPQPKSKSICQQ